jgi:putative DNA methylase
MIGSGKNALASSIVLSLRPRPADAPLIDRRGFVATLHRELPDALRKLQQGAIAPVDLPQAAIGPGMATFSRYARVLEDDGSPMSVRSALARINEVLDEVLAEQEGDFDTDTRFAIAWFRQHGFAPGDFGSADNLARARNSSVARLARLGFLRSGGGEVQLLRPDELSAAFDPGPSDTVTAWEFVLRLAQAVATEGIPGAARLMAYSARVGNADTAKELGFLLFSIAENRKLTEVAVMFNALGTAWNEAATAVRLAPDGPLQGAFDFNNVSTDTEG